MYRREEGRYECKRRDRREDMPESKDKDYKSSRRNRWDDRGSESVRPDDKRWDDESKRSLNTNWESKGRDYDRDRESSSSHSRCRDRRSRSRSPFRRNFRDCANPSKDEYSLQNEDCNHSLKKRDNQLVSSRQNTSWSDSSEEDDRSGKADSNNTLSSRKLTDQQHLHFGGADRKHQVPATGVMTTQQMKPLPNEVDGGNSSSSGISLKLGGASLGRMPLPKVISVSVPVKSSKVAAIFNTDDDDDEPEDMPPECKMRMKNVGRETKTSEGPNSFGKTKIGFCNMSHLAEKHLEGKPVPNKKP